MNILLIILVAIVVMLIAAKLILEWSSAPQSDIAEQDTGYTFPNGIKAGNIQIIGNADFQSNYFTTVSSEDGSSLLAVVADGLSNDESGKLASVIAVETLKCNFSRNLHKSTTMESFFEASFRQMQKSLKDHIDLNKFGTKLAAVIIDGGVLNYAAIGDCVIFIRRDKELIFLNDDYAKCIDEIPIRPKDVVMLASRGAWESLTETEIIWYLGLEDHPQEKCRMLLKRAQEKRLRQGNSTIIILEGFQTMLRAHQHLQQV